MKILNILCKRESLTLPIDDVDETHDYLTIYNQDGEIVARSEPFDGDEDTDLEYDGYIFMAPPVAIEDGEYMIYITVQSIKNKMSNG